MATRQQRLLAFLILGLAVACGWFAYAPALTGAFLLDDLSNLNGLRLVEDRLSALMFTFSGDAGPIGRPLALATFVPQAAAWAETAEPFLRINILIHLVNACLLALAMYRLSLASRIPEDKALFVALAAPAIWLFMPLLASSSLMIVQRMTTLSAFFVLLGLIGYLWARKELERQTARALTGMSFSLFLGTGLAVLAKESGALLPVLVLALEATVLAPPGRLQRSNWRIWKAIFLLLPACVILGYLVWRVPYSSELVLRRDFTAWQRLLTESRVLWQYLFNALFPQPGAFGPFHDGYPVARTLVDPVTMLAFSAWIAVLVLAGFHRRRYPLLAVAVLWFLGGHLLESTVVPLELYFEHRNYVPIIGPIFALCALLARLPEGRLRLAYTATLAFVVINALVLYSQSTLWGNPPAAAAYWQAHSPESVRAATTNAQFRLGVDGPGAAVEALHAFALTKPEDAYILIPALNLSCMIAPKADHRAVVLELKRLLKDVNFSYSAGTMLSELFTTVSRITCNGVDNKTVQSLAQSLISNRRYSSDDAFNGLHQQLLARILRDEGDYEQAIHHLQNAIAYRPSPDLNMMVVTTYAGSMDFDAARAFINAARRNSPRHPIKRFVWSNQLDELTLYIDELASHAEGDE